MVAVRRIVRIKPATATVNVMSDKHIHLQPLGGIAGDMFVAAMLDAFPEHREQVFADIFAVLPEGLGEVRLTQVLKKGISALHFSLDESSPTDAPAGLELDPAVSAKVGAVEQAKASYRNVRAPTNTFRSPNRHGHSHDDAIVSDYGGIKKLIESARLSGSTTTHALAILEILAQAESAIHGVPLEKVHFHELAAWDSLMDVVAAGSVISAIGEAMWSISALPLGSGQVKTQHGLLPVPAPATLRILEAYPWRSDNTPGERVTPTGAAIVRHLVPRENLSIKPEGTLLADGYGAGTKNFAEIANILRVMVFDRAPKESLNETRKTVAVVQFDIDDMTGEEIGIAAERLRREKGVLDLLLIPAQGKKGRPVTMFHLLVDPILLERCCNLIFLETSTIGLRSSVMDRIVLPRDERRTDEGLRFKEVRRPNGEVTAKIESAELESTTGLASRRQIKTAAEGAR